MVELLSPVGDFECLKAAVQNGANSVYFGADNFSARAFATNFSLKNLEKAIQYAKIRGVKTHLTLNTLVTDTEFESAMNIAKKAYSYKSGARGISRVVSDMLEEVMKEISDGQGEYNYLELQSEIVNDKKRYVLRK